ncbi:MAG: hypothetical protein RI601_12800, partial [Desulfurivibrionaceae bacterium]|nr:hypothetical protein [Desulfurivibrionaceae bacterium]
GSKDEKGRQFLSAIKDARTAYNDGPAREIYTLVEHYQRHQKLSAIFIMVREFKEMIKMQKVLGGQTLLVVNNTVLPGPTELAFLAQVPAEYQYDLVVKNNGTIGNLEREASLFAKHEVLTG